MLSCSPIRRACINRPTAVLLVLILMGSSLPSQTDYTFHAETEMVLVNVTVRDKSGKVVRDMKPVDFRIKEDGKLQKVVSFDIENTDAVPALDVAQAKPLENTPASSS